eukprot:5675036-Amphidinium_carterae.1
MRSYIIQRCRHKCSSAVQFVQYSYYVPKNRKVFPAKQTNSKVRHCNWKNLLHTACEGMVDCAALLSLAVTLPLLAQCHSPSNALPTEMSFLVFGPCRPMIFAHVAQSVPEPVAMQVLMRLLIGQTIFDTELLTLHTSRAGGQQPVPNTTLRMVYANRCNQALVFVFPSLGNRREKRVKGNEKDGLQAPASKSSTRLSSQQVEHLSDELLHLALSSDKLRLQML